MQNTERVNVEPIEFGHVSPKLKEAVEQMVHCKYIMDNAVSSNWGAMLAGDLHAGGYGPHEPYSFLYKILPFISESCLDRGKSYKALVPTSHTLGCSWRWRTSSLTEDEIERLKVELTDTQALIDGTLNPAAYTYFKSLGIVAPSEGKNRCDFLRGQGIQSIPAEVSERGYPAPERIKIYNVEQSGFRAMWAVLDERWVQVISHPSWTIPILQAYGVTTSRWPENYPLAEQVQLAFFESSGTTSAFGNPDLSNDDVVDLATITARGEHQSERITSSLIDLKHVCIDSRLWKSAGAAFLLSSIALVAAPSGWIELRIMAAMVWGGALTAACVPLMSIIRTRRKDIKRELPLPLEKAPKYEHIARPRLYG